MNSCANEKLKMKLCYWSTGSNDFFSECFKVAIKLLNIRNGWRRSRQREWISCIQVNIYRHMGINCTFTLLYNWSVAKVFCHIQSTQLHPIMRQYRRNLLLSRIWQFINEGYETQMILVRISFPRYLIFIFFVAQVNLSNYLGKRIKPYQHWEPIYIGTNEVTGPNIKFS